MLVSLKDGESKKKEAAWEQNGFFNVQRSELADNTLVYVNN